jgi:hypothetical protein
MTSSKPPQFGLGKLFSLTTLVAIALWAWQSRLVELAARGLEEWFARESMSVLEGLAWLPVPAIGAILAVEAAARAIPRVIEVGTWFRNRC